MTTLYLMICQTKIDRLKPFIKQTMYTVHVFYAKIFVRKKPTANLSHTLITLMLALKFDIGCVD
jgi:hypothetical protein